MEEKKILVAGAGVSGIAAAQMVLDMGEGVILYDGNASRSEADLRAKFAPGADVEIVLGTAPDEVLDRARVCCISPGIPMRAPFVSQLLEHGIPIWSEIELAYRYARGRLAAITGTNGKTTTTALTGEILRRHFPSTFVVGNIGYAYTGEALKTREDSVTVAEVSSFQLETIEKFHPQVSAILNITPDHLDRHGDFPTYVRMKKAITKNQTDADTCVLNYDDPVLRPFGDTLPCHVIYFSSRQELSEGLFLRGERIIWRRRGREEDILGIHDMNLLGRHNYENVMAAVAITSALGVPMQTIRDAVREFKAVEHRIEYVTEVRGVKYYHDSKGTNPDAAIQAVRAMVRPTVLIAGGYDKHAQYTEWIESFGTTVKALVLIGQTADAIEAEARRLGFTNIVRAEDMPDAVAKCAALAEDGDAVLLSPACASWGMFDNFEQRGRIFKDCVRAL
ncbi:MAG: UDP-N-acetylmuramoyl-L-alanine--D-glutamate ligase [Lachnospiraceae bacterium]|nr:UDP-N-acetylmuramoyl-L-alanine--D-glutamate ligase [Lachnospiraceae bacterium]